MFPLWTAKRTFGGGFWHWSKYNGFRTSQLKRGIVVVVKWRLQSIKMHNNIFLSSFPAYSVNLSFCLSASGRHLPDELGESAVKFALQKWKTLVFSCLILCASRVLTCLQSPEEPAYVQTAPCWSSASFRVNLLFLMCQNFCERLKVNNLIKGQFCAKIMLFHQFQV